MGSYKNRHSSQFQLFWLVHMTDFCICFLSELFIDLKCVVDQCDSVMTAGGLFAYADSQRLGCALYKLSSFFFSGVIVRGKSS